MDLESLGTVEEVEAGGVRGKMSGFQERYNSKSVEVSAVILAVVTLVGRTLDLERQKMKRKQTLVEVEWNLQVSSGAALLTRDSAFAKVEKTCKCHGDLKGVEQWLGVAQIVAIKGA